MTTGSATGAATGARSGTAAGGEGSRPRRLVLAAAWWPRARMTSGRRPEPQGVLMYLVPRYVAHTAATPSSFPGFLRLEPGAPHEPFLSLPRRRPRRRRRVRVGRPASCPCCRPPPPLARAPARSPPALLPACVSPRALCCCPVCPCCSRSCSCARACACSCADT